MGTSHLLRAKCSRGHHAFAWLRSALYSRCVTPPFLNIPENAGIGPSEVEGKAPGGRRGDSAYNPSFAAALSLNNDPRRM